MAGGIKRPVPGSKGGAKPEGGGRAPHVGSFLSKTFTIFSTESYKQFCGFSPDGDSVVIHNVHDFAAKILPRHFKHSNMQSFVRQLNMYGFRKVPSEPTTARFRHQNFKRGRPDLLYLIKRKAAEEKTKTEASATDTSSPGATAGMRPMGVAAAQAPAPTSGPVGLAGGGASDPAKVGDMQQTLQVIWQRIQRLEAARGIAPAPAGTEWPGSSQGANGNGGAVVPVSQGLGLFNTSGIITAGLDLSSFPTHTDSSLNELVSLREGLDRIQNRMAAMEVEHTSLLNQNQALWSHLDTHQNRQAQLQKKLQRILMFMYQMHLHMGGNASSRGIDQAQNHQLPGSNQSISALAESLFNDNISYLCMKHPIPEGSNATLAQMPQIRALSDELGSPFSTSFPGAAPTPPQAPSPSGMPGLSPAGNNVPTPPLATAPLPVPSPAASGLGGVPQAGSNVPTPPLATGPLPVPSPAASGLGGVPQAGNNVFAPPSTTAPPPVHPPSMSGMGGVSPRFAQYQPVHGAPLTTQSPANGIVNGTVGMAPPFSATMTPAHPPPPPSVPPPGFHGGLRPGGSTSSLSRMSSLESTFNLREMPSFDSAMLGFSPAMPGGASPAASLVGASPGPPPPPPPSSLSPAGLSASPALPGAPSQKRRRIDVGTFGSEETGDMTELPSQDLWDVVLGFEDDGAATDALGAPVQTASGMPNDYRASVSGLSSSSANLGRREDSLFQHLDSIENNLATLANIRNAIDDNDELLDYNFTQPSGKSPPGGGH